MEILKYILAFGVIPAAGAAIIFVASDWSVRKLLADAEKRRQERLEALGEQGANHNSNNHEASPVSSDSHSSAA